MLENQPFFSIVMPTRNRAVTLRYAIQTALFQDFDDFEVVVSDNFSSDDTREVALGCNDSRVRHVRTAELIPMTMNWEFGISNARGKYVILLSDDDGLLRDTLSTLHAIITKNSPQVIYWHRGHYNWPKCPLGEFENHLIYTEPLFKAGFVPSQQIIGEVVRFADANASPCLINSAIDRDVLERLKAKTGKYILSYAPDTASGMTISCMVDRVYKHDRVLSVAGISHLSNGTLLMKKRKSNVETEFSSLNKKVSDYTTKYMDSLGGSVTAITLDSIFDVSRYFPEKVSIDQVDWIHVYAQSIVEYGHIADAAMREEYISNIYKLAQETHGSLAILRLRMRVLYYRFKRWMNMSTSLQPISSFLRFILRKPYSSKRYFNGDEYGFSDILGACEFLSSYYKRGGGGDFIPLRREFGQQLSDRISAAG